MKPDVNLQVNYQLDNALNSFIRLSTRPTPRSGYNCKVLLIMEYQTKYEITQVDNLKAHTINYNTLSASANGSFNRDCVGNCNDIDDSNNDDDDDKGDL